MASTEVARKAGRRWRQFGLRTLGLLVLLAALGMAAWRTLLAEHFLVKWIERQKGTATTEPALPDWLAWLPGSERCVHITEINLAGCRIGDGDLWRFEKLPKLRKATLTNSDVSLAAAEALVTARPEIGCSIAFGDRLYKATWNVERDLNSPVDYVLESGDLAARYKLAVAECGHDTKQHRLAALKQKLEWMNRLSAAIAQVNREPATENLDNCLLACERLSLQLSMAAIAGDQEQFVKLGESTTETANSLVSAATRALDEGFTTVGRAIASLERAVILRSLAERGSNDQQKQLEILLTHDRDLKRVAHWVAEQYFASQLEGMPHNWALVVLSVLANQSRIAAARGDPAAQLQSLERIPYWADRLRQSVGAAYDAGIVTKGDWLGSNEKAWSAELSYARFQQDETAVTAILRARQAALDARLRRFVDGMWTYEGGPDWGEWEFSFWLCAAMTAHLEDEGRPFFEQGFRAYLKKQLR